MTRILITSGPTRQFLDPVRYLTNASSGRMGSALAAAVIELGYEVVVVSGPVDVAYPAEAKVVPVLSTEDMLDACIREFPACDGLIGAAAPCDYRPVKCHPHKISKTGDPVQLTLMETPDVVATIGAQKRPDQWVVGFALETQDPRFRAIVKLEKKRCDLIVLNGPEAMNSSTNQVEILDPEGRVVVKLEGTKDMVAAGILQQIRRSLLAPQRSHDERDQTV
ncbi:MAG: phosphopantothenoylcysteine decarboxylase [Pirellulaceae bacterium]|nr:phosphopantothenoylcysteine decarboxylase [Pirellulaceae bacterium]